jgi:hypothetical protein
MRVYPYWSSGKTILLVWIILAGVLNVIIATGIYLYTYTNDQRVVTGLLLLIADIFLLLRFLLKKQTLVITDDSMIIFYRWRKVIYKLSEFKSLRFYYDTATDDSGQIIKGINICEILLVNGERVTIPEEEIDGFNDFKFYIIEKNNQVTD